MVRTVGPIKKSHGADFDANAISSTNVPVDCDICSMNPELCGRFYWSPNVMAVVLTDDFAFVLKIRINWQKSFTFVEGKRRLKY